MKAIRLTLTFTVVIIRSSIRSLSMLGFTVAVGQALFISVGQSASTIDLVDRTVEAQIPGTLDSETFSDPGNYVMTVTAGAAGTRPSSSASINSLAQPLLFSGLGSGQISGEGHPDTFGNVTYLTSLTLDVPHSFVLTGAVRASADGGFATASFTLDDKLNNLFDFVADSDLAPGPIAFSESGVLAAGSYQFLALLITDDQGEPSFYDASAGFEFSLALQPVPEPCSLLLIAVGTAWAVNRRWGRRGSGRVYALVRP
jgi:hypothetical protein